MTSSALWRLARTCALAMTVGATLCLIAPAAPAASQGSTVDSARVGERVKLLMAADTVMGRARQTLFGDLTAKAADTLTVDPGRGIAPFRVQRSAIDKLYISRGVPTRKQSATGGAIGGAVVGAGFGLLLTLVSDADVWDVVQHTLLDTTLGAALGWLLPQESWKRVQR